MVDCVGEKLYGDEQEAIAGMVVKIGGTELGLDGDTFPSVKSSPSPDSDV